MKRLLVLILVLLFTNTPTMGQDPSVEEGKIKEAPYRIQIPSEWNHGLVVYAHGYRPRGGSWYPLSKIMASVFLDRGFALAESGYSRQGWALEEAVEETEALRRFIVKKHPHVKQVYVTGHSMGGLITLALIEKYPASYDGALPMCGPLVPALQFFKEPIFDMVVTFEALYKKALPEELKPVMEAPALPRKAITDALSSDPDLTAAFAGHWCVREKDLPDIIGLYHRLYHELKDRAGGHFIDNRNTVYTGFAPIWERKIEVSRYEADPEALDYVRRHYTPSGKLEDPVLAVHTAYDPGVPPRLANFYHLTVSLQGTEKWFVNKHVEAEGHCNIQPLLMGQAFDELRRWAEQGIRPNPGILRAGS